MKRVVSYLFIIFCSFHQVFSEDKISFGYEKTFYMYRELDSVRIKVEINEEAGELSGSYEVAQQVRNNLREKGFLSTEISSKKDREMEATIEGKPMYLAKYFVVTISTNYCHSNNPPSGLEKIVIVTSEVEVQSIKFSSNVSESIEDMLK